MYHETGGDVGRTRNLACGGSVDPVLRDGRDGCVADASFGRSIINRLSKILILRY
jgi:hypothetical protein